MVQGQNIGQRQIIDQGHIPDEGQILGQGVCGCIWLRQMVNVCVCVWLHLASPNDFVDSADGASCGLIR